MSALKKIPQAAFSTAVWTTSFVWMGAVATTWAVSGIFVSPRKTHNYIGGPGMAAVLKITLSDIEVIYHPDFDPERRSVFCQNHVNLLDAHVACKSIPHAFCGLMNAWQFHIPVYGWIMKLADGIPVPKGQGRFRSIAEAAKDRAAKGISILAFPEAHRTLDGEVREFKKGVFLMAKMAGLPVVPLAVHGMRDLMQKGSLLVKPAKIKVFVGPQLDTAGLKAKELDALVAKTQRIVADFVRTGEVPSDEVIKAPLRPASGGDAPETSEASGS
ncbi:MAG: 1-acyl-sn-glycerol-3-phosphate acyltransferase [Myxococcales bacterium]|nr:1-acyl-sn-glycerol-3-phosphate acyltransferase [Myxococcales bacterium]MCB9701608.1 1-acyl-sn-glycerol-3-phosphate acyltransferase [Myxococcales bacterium]